MTQITIQIIDFIVEDTRFTTEIPVKTTLSEQTVKEITKNPSKISQ